MADDPRKKFVLRIDRWHPTRLNQLLHCHWARRNRLKRFDADVIALAVVAADVPIATMQRRVTIEIALGPRQRGGDPDAYWKSLLDGLVKCGALRDDSRTWCQLGEVAFSRARLWGTVIVLENMHDPDCVQSVEEVQMGKQRYRLHSLKVIDTPLQRRLEWEH